MNEFFDRHRYLDVLFFVTMAVTMFSGYGFSMLLALAFIAVRLFPMLSKGKNGLDDVPWSAVFWIGFFALFVFGAFWLMGFLVIMYYYYVVLAYFDSRKS